MAAAHLGVCPSTFPFFISCSKGDVCMNGESKESILICKVFLYLIRLACLDQSGGGTSRVRAITFIHIFVVGAAVVGKKCCSGGGASTAS